MVVMFIAIFLIVGFYLATCSLLAMWVAFGDQSVSVRLPIFLLASIPLGTVGCLFEDGNSGDQFGSLAGLLLALTVAAVVDRRSSRAIVIFLVTGLPTLAFVISHWHTSGATIAQYTLAIAGVGAALSLFRLIGIRLVRLCPDSTDLEMELATGRNLDGWIDFFDRTRETHTNHAEMVRHLRQQGHSDYWRRSIARAYDHSSGRCRWSHDFADRGYLIAHHIIPSWSEMVRHLRQHRFTIRQLMVWSLAAATLFGFFRFAGRMTMNGDQIVIGMTLSLAAAIISAVCAYGVLGLRRRVPYLVLLMLVLAVGNVIPRTIAFFPGGLGGATVFSGGATGYAVVLSLALILVRKQGYRVVRLASEPFQHSPGQHSPGQHSPGQHSPGQHSPGQHSPLPSTVRSLRPN